MLRFFRTIRKKIIEEDNVRKYLLYAIGEILLVVIGILIALQVNNWNEQRKERQREMTYLYKLLEEAKRDSSSLQSTINLTEYKITQAERLLDILKQNIPIADSTEFVRDVFLVGRGASTRPYLPSYEELIATGSIGIIQNRDITDLLARYIAWGEMLKSFIYEDAEERRSAHMEHIHHYFSAMIMNDIWEAGDDGVLDLERLNQLGIDIEGFRKSPHAIYHVQNTGALNLEINRMHQISMDRYVTPILKALREEIKTLKN